MVCVNQKIKCKYLAVKCIVSFLLMAIQLQFDVTVYPGHDTVLSEHLIWLEWCGVSGSAVHPAFFHWVLGHFLGESSWIHFHQLLKSGMYRALLSVSHILSINPINPVIVHVPCCLSHQESDSGTHTTLTSKIYSKRTTCVIDIEVILFDASKLVVLWYGSSGHCIIVMWSSGTYNLVLHSVWHHSMYEVRSSSKVSDFFSQDWEQIDTCGLV
jgi:hypothetical protein